MRSPASPGGGRCRWRLYHVEHPRDAVVREVYEEAGLPATVHELSHGSWRQHRRRALGRLREAPGLPLLDSARLGLEHALRRHRTVYHLALADDWAAARDRGEYVVSARGRSLDEEGFVHCAWRYQLPAVAEALYADVDELLVLAVDLDRVPSPVRLESGGADECFPHVYGPIPVAAVTAVSSCP